MSIIRRHRVRTRAWTAADYDSYEVLATLGVTAPAVRVTQARAGRPFRRAVRGALRTARRSAHIAWPGAELKRRPAN